MTMEGGLFLWLCMETDKLGQLDESALQLIAGGIGIGKTKMLLVAAVIDITGVQQDALLQGLFK